MTKKILIINGPNLNLLGDREESKYGKVTLEEVKKNCESHAKSIGFKISFKQLNIEVELGFTLDQTVKEVERCLNCDIQTVFAANLCIECDACIDVCPVDCLTITENGDEDDLRTRLTAPAENLEEDLYVSEPLPQTSRVMVKDEDLCVHCGLCAERCPTGAWDMQKSTILLPHVKDELEASRVKKASNS